MRRSRTLPVIAGLLLFANLTALPMQIGVYAQMGFGDTLEIFTPKRCGCSMSQEEHRENLKALRLLRDQYASASSAKHQDISLKPLAVNCWGDPLEYSTQTWCDWTYGGDCDGILGSDPAFLKQRNRCKYTDSRYCCGPWHDIGCCSEDKATAEPPCIQPGPGWVKCTICPGCP